MTDNKPAPQDDDTGKHKDVPITSRVSPDVAKKARERAEKEKRTLSEILRSWLTLFSQDEAPSPPVIDNKRATQRPPKPKAPPPPKPKPAPPPAKKKK